MLAPLSQDEDERLRELTRCGILDTPPEPTFDRLTRLAARTFKVPIALISLVDRDRQWFKSHVGTDTVETPHEYSFCTHTIQSPATLVVPDTLRDPRFADHPLVTDAPFIRFYAGAPLTTPRGHRLGTLCVIDTAPRRFTVEDVVLLEDLASLVIDELELRLDPTPGPREIERRKRADRYMHATHDELIARVEECSAARADAEARYRSLFENALCGIYQTRPDGGLLDANPAFATLLGYPCPATLLDTLQVMDTVYVLPGRRAELRQRLETEGIVTGLESEIQRPDGTRLWISENARTVRDADGRLLRCEGNAEDVTARRNAADALQHARDELEDRVRGRTAELALFNGTLLQQINECRHVGQDHEDRVRQQTAMAELSRYALQGPELPEIFAKASELVARALEVTFGTVTEFLPDRTHLRVRGAFGWPIDVVGRTLANWRTPTPDGRLCDSEPLVIADVRQDPRYATRPEVMQPGGPVSVASVVIHSSGQPYGTLVALSSTPREFGSRDVSFLQTVADLLSTFIEAKHQENVSRHAEARYQHIVANIPGIVFQYGQHTDGTPFLPFISHDCQHLYGHDAATLRATPSLATDAIHPDDRPAHDAGMALSAATLQPFEWEGRIHAPADETRWVTVRARPGRQDNGDTIWDGLVLDVTELKHTQETLREAKEEAEKANHAKSEFLSRMSHELRTPLNAILGFGQLLRLDPLAPSQASSVDQILRSGRHLLDLINEVLEIAHIDSGKMAMEFEPVGAGAALAEAAQFTRPLAEQHHITFLPVGVPADAALTVTADRERLKQVLLNLFSNAVKYNRENGEVRYACEALPDGRTVRLCVTDTGPGLEADEVARLFTPFQRLGAATRGIVGTGIGLTITRSLVEAMGGTVGVKSTPGRGSTFFVDLPAAAPTPPGAAAADVVAVEPAPPTVPAAALTARRTVLCIDDQEDNLALIERLFDMRADLRLVCATDGLGGLTLARAHHPDLILLDMHLPDLTGEEVLRRMRDEEEIREIPVVILSAESAPAQVERLRQLGVNEYLLKPFQLQLFLQMLGRMLPPVAVTVG